MWLEKKLPNEKKLPGELKDCIAPLFSCLEDRNATVRQAAQASVQYFMAHVGFEAMSKATAKLDVSNLVDSVVNNLLLNYYIVHSISCYVSFVFVVFLCSQRRKRPLRIS